MESTQTDQFYLTGRYNLGYRKEPVEGGEKGEFVPVASLILTSRYREQYRRFYPTIRLMSIKKNRFKPSIRYIGTVFITVR